MKATHFNFCWIGVALIVYGSICIFRPQVKAVRPKYIIAPDYLVTEGRTTNGNPAPLVNPIETSYQSVCWNTQVTDEECKVLQVTEKEETLTFPHQVVSGVPGSGNDWILWLGSITHYTGQTQCRYVKVYPGINKKSCLFEKMHGPWFRTTPKKVNESISRATLLLRHPFDSAFAEYKMQAVSGSIGGRDSSIKNSTKGISLSKFITHPKNTTNFGLKAFLEKMRVKWLRHAQYWLQEYPKPVHVLIYTSVKSQTSKEIEEMQQFFGYRFNGVNFRRHCCIMQNTLNPTLKRQKSEVDEYKEVIYGNEQELQIRTNDTIRKVHAMLDERFPNKHYRVRRG
ncbi:uncharacterized protein [Watersipora subatra]|uniref:uncharacterized protein n=1 Tax=Watersipora subatra TaxID=2589382 RepID=UPI00355B93FE